MQQGYFDTCDNVQSSALACHFQVLSSFTTDRTHMRGGERLSWDQDEIFLIRDKLDLSGQEEGLCHSYHFHPC